MRHLILERQARLAEHAFFRALDRYVTPSSIVRLAPALAFWCRALRAVLHAEAARRSAASAQSGEEQSRYFEDVERLMGRRLPPALVASDAHPLMREASYQLLYEVVASDTDGKRLVLLESLDAMRDLFFRRVAPLAASLCEELEHDDDGDPKRLPALALPPGDEPEAAALVDRVFTAFERMFDGVAAMHA